MRRVKNKIFILLLLVLIISGTVPNISVGAASGYEVKYETVSNWGSGFLGMITVKNNGSNDIEQWKLEFDWDRSISAVWNGKIQSCENNHYVISFVDWNKVIYPKKSTSFYLMGSPGNVASKPQNLLVKDIYDRIANEDREWQQYAAMKTGEAFQKSFPHGIAYLWSRFPVDEPHRIGYEIIEKNPVEKFIQARYQNVVIPTKDGIKLKGLFFPVKNAKGTIIMLHGYGSTAIWETAKLKYLIDNGYQILSYNSRYWNYYDTPDKYVELMSNEVKDVDCAVSYLKTRCDVDENKIGIYGFSYGACKAEIYAGMTNDVKVFMIDGGSANVPTYSTDITWEMIANDVVKITHEEYGDDPSFWSLGMLPSPYINSIQRLNKPALFIHGIKDSIPVSEVEELYQAASGPKEMYVFQNSGHCDAMYTPDKEDYENKVLAFLEKYLR